MLAAKVRQGAHHIYKQNLRQYPIIYSKDMDCGMLKH